MRFACNRLGATRYRREDKLKGAQIQDAWESRTTPVHLSAVHPPQSNRPRIDRRRDLKLVARTRPPIPVVPAAATESERGNRDNHPPLAFGNQSAAAPIVIRINLSRLQNRNRRPAARSCLVGDKTRRQRQLSPQSDSRLKDLAIVEILNLT